MINAFRVKYKCTGEILMAKYFRDMTDEEVATSTVTREGWDDSDIFIEPRQGSNVWRYMIEGEVIPIVETQATPMVETQVVPEVKLIGEFIGWSNGKIVRRYQGQDKGGVWRTGSSRGFKKMLIKIYELEKKDDKRGEIQESSEDLY